METLLIFFAIIAIQMIAAYTSKQKKEATKPIILPQEIHREPVKEIKKKIIRVPAKEEPVLDEAKVEIKKPEITIKEETPIQKFSILNSQLNIKNPAQGILWNAILHEPRYRVKWKRR